MDGYFPWQQQSTAEEKGLQTIEEDDLIFFSPEQVYSYSKLRFVDSMKEYSNKTGKIVKVRGRDDLYAWFEKPNNNPTAALQLYEDSPAYHADKKLTLGKATGDNGWVPYSPGSKILSKYKVQNQKARLLPQTNILRQRINGIPIYLQIMRESVFKHEKLKDPVVNIIDARGTIDEVTSEERIPNKMKN